VWSPVLLTALAWVVAIVGVWQKLSRIQVIDDERAEEDQARRVPISHNPCSNSLPNHSFH
jgi:heme exporter protein D